MIGTGHAYMERKREEREGERRLGWYSHQQFLAPPLISFTQ